MARKALKTTLLVPTYNELSGMKAIMPRIKRDWVDEILVVDGGDDGTDAYALEQGYRVHKQKSKGLSAAYREAVQIASGDVIITFSPDGNSVPELIPVLIAKINEGYDMVVVSRYLEGAKSYDDDRVTAFGNWMFTKMINLCFGAKYTDSLVMFRAWKKGIFPLIKFDPLRGGFEPLFGIICAKHGLKVGEIPGDEPARTHGERKMSPLFNGLGILYLMGREMITPKREWPKK